MKHLDMNQLKISRDSVKRVFLFSFIFGIVAHGSMLSKTILWHDGLHYAYQVKPGFAVSLGRWLRVLLSTIVSKMFGGANLGMPMLYGLVSLFFIAASALVIVRIFDIRNSLMQAVLCGIMVSFPVVTSTFFYMYTAPYYFLGLLLSTLAVLVARERGGVTGFAAGALCVCCTLGIYQAYLAVAVSLFVISLITDILNDRYDGPVAFLKRAFYYLGICVVGFAVYMVTWKLSMKITGTAAASYQGISDFGKKGIGTYLQGVRTAYARFFLIFKRKHQNLYPMGMRYVQIVVIALTIVASACIVVRQFLKNKLLGVALAVLIVLLPVCFNVVYLIGANSVHTVMLYGECMLYVYLICVAGHLLRRVPKLGVPGWRLAALVMVALIAMNAYYDNGCYMKAEMMLQQTINSMTMLAARIKMLDGYNDTMPVCIAIKGEKDNTATQDKYMAEFAIVPLSHLIHHDDAGGLRNIKDVLAQWCGFSPKYVEEKTLEHPEVLDEMPDYPDAGSVKIVDGTVVVRM